ncbi:hypothetical protein HX746_30825 (plasmid) [Rhodococcus erythropolis]|uniref:hypothetical protein n=1 Tax=Rhodococcus erythropolis TaxID=1833 RepID=UPI001ADB9B66|nr:hypothetical protein [Rhodococcus erythropolis]MBO8150680.1 hypothetical protein [Rhodococcus erythropolis]
MTETSTPRRKSLASAFAAKGNRAEGLAGLLPTAGSPTQPRRSTPVTEVEPAAEESRPAEKAPAAQEPPQAQAESPAPTTAVPVPVHSEPVSKPEPTPPPAPAPTEKQAPIYGPSPDPTPVTDDVEPSTEIGKVTVTAYLDRATRDALQSRAAERRCDHADVAIEAFDSVGIAGLRSLFQPVAGRSAAGIPVHQEPFAVKGPVETWFRFTTAQRDWLDAQVKVVGSKSRSRLLAGVLSLHLRTASR